MIITDTPNRALEKCAMDIIGPLPMTKYGNKYILSIQDQLSRFVILVALRDQTAETIADSFIKKYICIFGSPKVVLTVKGTNFCSKLIKAIAKRFKFKKIETTAFSPSSNGTLERAHHPLCEYLRNFTDKNTECDEILDLAQFHYNVSTHSTHKFKPYEILFGLPPRIPSQEPLQKSESIPTVENYLKKLIDNMREITQIAQENITSAKEKSKKYYDRYTKEVIFEIGDMVCMIRESLKGKLEKDHYTGPFEILKVNEKSNITINYKGKPKIN